MKRIALLLALVASQLGAQTHGVRGQLAGQALQFMNKMYREDLEQAVGVPRGGCKYEINDADTLVTVFKVVKTKDTGATAISIKDIDWPDGLPLGHTHPSWATTVSHTDIVTMLRRGDAFVFALYSPNNADFFIDGSKLDGVCSLTRS